MNIQNNHNCAHHSYAAFALLPRGIICTLSARHHPNPTGGDQIMNSKSLTAVVISALFTLAACGGAEPEAPAATESMAKPAAAEPAVAAPADLRTLLASESRAADDRARDAGRKPAEVVEFLGIEAGMSVIDVIAAGGYYTEVLSLAVGSDGRVIAQNPAFVLEFRDGANEKAISERLAGNRLPNVSRVNGGVDAVSSADGQYDAALTALNFHDIYNGQGVDAAVAELQAIHGLLKSGGVFGIIDHAGAAGADNESLHRIEAAKVLETAEAAGFMVDGQSDILANPADDHTQGVFAEGLRGSTDRFVIKLRKP
jgi:predicted methyltransferase